MDETLETQLFTDLVRENRNHQETEVRTSDLDTEHVYEQATNTGEQAEHQYAELRHTNLRPTDNWHKDVRQRDSNHTDPKEADKGRFDNTNVKETRFKEVVICVLTVTNIVAATALAIAIYSLTAKVQLDEGSWSEWTPWSVCDVTCGNGSQTRFRICTKPLSLENSQKCGDNWSEKKNCQLVACSNKGTVDGGWSEWSAWSVCDATCGNGSQSRIRTCTNPIPSTSGQQCADNWSEKKQCQQTSCSINGNWSDWTSWSACDVTCGNGSKTRFRGCNNPPSSGNGRYCTDSWNELMPCSFTSCTVNGGWSHWSEWSVCDVTCGNGSQSRIRTCTNPPPTESGQNCTENWSEKKSCQQALCSVNETVNGNWSDWTTWSACDVTCGNGSKTRFRACNNPPPSGNGRYCMESWNEIMPCNFTSCTVDGGWSHWSAWSVCDVTCGNGSQNRIRTCTNPPPTESGQNCTENWSEKKSCQQASCSINETVNGNWSEWTTWSACDVTCGNGSKTRFRACNNPPPSGNGRYCTGSWNEIMPCNFTSCTVDGGWSDWSAWSACDVTCGNGSQMRIRTCTNPLPTRSGQECADNWNEKKNCQYASCSSNEKDSGTMVGFTAYGNSVVNGSMNFPTIIMNYGGGYDNSTGKFTCKVAGIYYFALHVGKTLYTFTTSVTCSIYLNSAIQLSAAEIPYPNDVNNRNGLSLSLSGALYLNENDIVSIGCSGVSSTGRLCSFTGFLVAARN